MIYSPFPLTSRELMAAINALKYPILPSLCPLFSLLAHRRQAERFDAEVLQRVRPINGEIRRVLETHALPLVSLFFPLSTASSDTSGSLYLAVKCACRRYPKPPAASSRRSPSPQEAVTAADHKFELAVLCSTSSTSPSPSRTTRVTPPSTPVPPSPDSSRR
jgi:hypothetical protein